MALQSILINSFLPTEIPAYCHSIVPQGLVHSRYRVLPEGREEEKMGGQGE